MSKPDTTTRVKFTLPRAYWRAFQEAAQSRGLTPGQYLRQQVKDPKPVKNPRRGGVGRPRRHDRSPR